MLLCLCYDGTTHLISAATGALLNTFVPQPPPLPDNPILPVTNGMNLNQFKAAVTSAWTAFFGNGVKVRASGDGDVFAAAFGCGDVGVWTLLYSCARVKLVGLTSAAAAPLNGRRGVLLERELRAGGQVRLSRNRSFSFRNALVSRSTASRSSSLRRYVSRSAISGNISASCSSCFRA